jgi:hypothetical protein
VSECFFAVFQPQRLPHAVQGPVINLWRFAVRSAGLGEETEGHRRRRCNRDRLLVARSVGHAGVGGSDANRQHVVTARVVDEISERCVVRVDRRAENTERLAQCRAARSLFREGRGLRGSFRRMDSPSGRIFVFQETGRTVRRYDRDAAVRNQQRRKRTRKAKVASQVVSVRFGPTHAALKVERLILQERAAFGRRNCRFVVVRATRRELRPATVRTAIADSRTGAGRQVRINRTTWPRDEVVKADHRQAELLNQLRHLWQNHNPLPRMKRRHAATELIVSVFASWFTLRPFRGCDRPNASMLR